MPEKTKEETDKALKDLVEHATVAGERLQAFMAKMPKYSSADPLTSFFYTLMRDHLTVGTVVKLIADSSDGQNAVFTNGHLAQFAELCSDEMKRNLLVSSD